MQWQSGNVPLFATDRRVELRRRIYSNLVQRTIVGGYNRPERAGAMGFHQLREPVERHAKARKHS